MIDESGFLSKCAQLERAWDSLDAPILGMLRPGLSDSQIDELMAPTGLVLPDELRWWWQWHDGAEARLPDADEEREIGPGGWLHLSLREAVELYDFHDGAYREYAGYGDMQLANITWRPGLFPLCQGVGGARDVLAVATLVEAHGPAPVMLRTFTGVESDCGAETVGELVGMWIELLESSRYLVEDGWFQPLDPMFTEEPRLRWVL